MKQPSREAMKRLYEFWMTTTIPRMTEEKKRAIINRNAAAAVQSA
ncbi:hypothetical protein [Tumebacillus flagellatus]|nr:hypothetical protein [Tumebacillus flagellatus]